MEEFLRHQGITPRRCVTELLAVLGETTVASVAPIKVVKICKEGQKNMPEFVVRIPKAVPRVVWQVLIQPPREQSLKDIVEIIQPPACHPILLIHPIPGG